MGNIELFDGMAQQYDTPERIKNTKVILGVIRKHLEGTQDKSAVDFGCGTGLIGLQLANEFHAVMLVDASQNMVDYVQAKIENGHIQNASTQCINLEGSTKNIGPVDYIIAVQVLLHIKDTRGILQKLYSSLKPNGHLILVDFNKNDNVSSDLVHNGFVQTDLTSILENIGFVNVRHETFYHGSHLFMGQDASLFIMDSQHPAL